ncbi:MAG: hypothetical protein AAGU76_02725 [Sedimentibacter sp.]|uniref:hypothetical protein n=1 Tax=Sedimentibacter sp. TaxID=1960295 RepID=UPI0031587190
MIDLGKLKITIETGADQAKKELLDVGDTAEKQESKFSKFGSALKTGAMVGVTAVTGLAAGMTKFATDTAQTTDRIDKMSAKLGISKKGFQEWDYVLGQNGMSIETMQSGMKTLVSQMDSAGQGTASAQEAFTALGLTWDDGTGKLKDQETMMNEAIMALADMENGTEKSRLATELFGKAGTELMPMLNNGSQAITDLTQRSHDLGLVMSDETVTAGVKLGDTMDDAKKSFGMVTTELGASFMPILQKLLDWVLSHMPEIQKVITTVFSVVEKIVIAVGKAFDVILPILTTLYNWIEPYFPVIQSIVETTFGAIGSAVQIVTDIFWGVVDAIKSAIEWLQSWNNTEADDKDVSGSGNNKPYRSSHASGLDYVPFNNFVANLHEGEAVLTAQQAEVWRSGSTSNINVVVNATVREEADIQKISRQIQRDIRIKQRGTVLA